MSAARTTEPASPTRLPAARNGGSNRNRGRLLRRAEQFRSSAPSEASSIQVTISLRLTGDHSQDRLLRALQELSADTGIETSISWPDPATSITGTVRADGPVPPVIPPPPAAPPHGRIGIRPAPRVVTVDDTPLDLSRLEYELLLFLAEHPARVFTRLQLLNHVWGHTHAGLRTVDVHVRRLRAKFGDEVPLLTTVHGVGYRLADAATIDIAPD